MRCSGASGEVSSTRVTVGFAGEISRFGYSCEGFSGFGGDDMGGCGCDCGSKDK